MNADDKGGGEGIGIGTRPLISPLASALPSSIAVAILPLFTGLGISTIAIGIQSFLGNNVE
jgi:hypothetical protein